MTVRGLRGLQRKLETLRDEATDAPNRAIRRNAQHMTAEMKLRVAQQDAYASGTLFRGIGYRRTPGTDTTVIYSRAGHSGYVEFGTGDKHVPNPYTERYSEPTFSPALVGALTQWATVKPTLQVGNTYGFATAVAYTISGRTDEPSGTPPQPFFYPTWTGNKPIMMTDVKAEFARAVRS